MNVLIEYALYLIAIMHNLGVIRILTFIIIDMPISCLYILIIIEVDKDMTGHSPIYFCYLL